MEEKNLVISFGYLFLALVFFGSIYGLVCIEEGKQQACVDLGAKRDTMGGNDNVCVWQNGDIEIVEFDCDGVFDYKCKAIIKKGGIN